MTDGERLMLLAVAVGVLWLLCGRGRFARATMAPLCRAPAPTIAPQSDPVCEGVISCA